MHSTRVFSELIIAKPTMIRISGIRIMQMIQLQTLLQHDW